MMTKLNKFLRLMQLINQLYNSPPKNSYQLGLILEVSSRSVYRYLELLELSGFDIKKNQKNQYYIDSSREIPEVTFTEKEIKLIKETLEKYGKNKALQSSINTKLEILAPEILTASQISRAKKGKILDQLLKAINSKRQIIIKKYHSKNSDTVSDRIVEPICVGGYFKTLVAYEASTNSNKRFSINQMDDVDILSIKQQNKDLHKTISKDVFGVSPRRDYRIFTIHLALTKNAQKVITQSYPATKKHIRKKRNHEEYIFKCSSFSIFPLNSLIETLKKDIKILEEHDTFGRSNYY